MDILNHPLSAIVLGVLLSLFSVLIAIENPAQIPLKLVIVRALPGLGLYVIAWALFSYLIFTLMLDALPPLGRLPLGLALSSLGFTVGLSVPLAIRGAKNNLLTVTDNKFVRLLTIVLQIFDEATALYLIKIIRRQERVADDMVFLDRQGVAERAVSRLFEFHIVEIARERRRLRLNIPEEQILGLLKTRDAHVKFKRLMRYLGYEDCLAAIEESIANLEDGDDGTGSPQRLYPNWPPHKGDRRISSDRRKAPVPCPVERRRLEHGRRKVNRPCVRDYILGHIDHLDASTD